MTRLPFRRLVAGALRRLMYIWVRSETIGQSAMALDLDRSKPVIYVLQTPSLSDLMVVEQECRKNALPRPLAPVSMEGHPDPQAFFFLDAPSRWLGRRSKPVIAPTLTRLVTLVSQDALAEAQIVPVSVFWGQSPARETSPWKLLFADSWAVTGRLRKLLTILFLGP